MQRPLAAVAVLVALMVAAPASADPVLYLFTAEIYDVGFFGGVYHNAVREGDLVTYAYVVDRDRQPLAGHGGSNGADTPQADYFLASLAWIDYGHGLGLEYATSTRGFGYDEYLPGSQTFCYDSRGCTQLWGSITPTRGLYLASVTDFDAWVTTPLPGIDVLDPFLSDAWISNGIVRQITAAPGRVPEPSTGWLVVMGLIGVSLHRLRSHVSARH